jgi:hypothetical protein
MELNRTPEGGLEPLAAKNIDTGLGLERMAQILQVRGALGPGPREGGGRLHRCQGDARWRACPWLLGVGA